MKKFDFEIWPILLKICRFSLGSKHKQKEKFAEKSQKMAAEEMEPMVFTDESFAKPKSDLFSWKLVTEDFLENCKDLELGELLHDNMFGLFEAMSAIEMMDPKMDAGMTKGAIKRKKPMTFQEAKEQKLLAWESIKISEFVHIFDHTLACLVTWLEGHSLAQTVFTNLVRFF